MAADVATEEGRAALLAACSDPDILVNNAGGPPPGDFRDWGEEVLAGSPARANMLAPIAPIRAVIDGMGAWVRPDRQYHLGGGQGADSLISACPTARPGRPDLVSGVARQAGKGVTINNILPGRFATDRLGNIAAGRSGAARFEEAERGAVAAVPAGRFGEPAEFGQLCAFLCSIHAGYVTGQNLLIDGGAFPGLL